MQIASVTHWALAEIMDLGPVDFIAYVRLAARRDLVVTRDAAQAATISQSSPSAASTFFSRLKERIDALTTRRKSLEGTFGEHLAEQMRASEEAMLAKQPARTKRHLARVTKG